MRLLFASFVSSFFGPAASLAKKQQQPAPRKEVSQPDADDAATKKRKMVISDDDEPIPDSQHLQKSTEITSEQKEIVEKKVKMEVDKGKKKENVASNEATPPDNEKEAKQIEQEDEPIPYSLYQTTLNYHVDCMQRLTGSGADFDVVEKLSWSGPYTFIIVVIFIFIGFHSLLLQPPLKPSSPLRNASSFWACSPGSLSK